MCGMNTWLLEAGSIALAGLATGLGALPLIWLREVPQALVDGMLGFAAGVMMSAASFSLMVPAFEQGRTLVPMLGLLAGAGLLALGDWAIPHLHAGHGAHQPWGEGRAGTGTPSGARPHVWLALMAVALDNLPEGLSIGVAFATGDRARATALAAVVALQNLPEGLAAALLLVRSGLGCPRAVLATAAAGLAEPIAALAGLLLVRSVGALLPLALAFAAGAMIYAAVDEMLPEALSHGHFREVAAGVVAGYALIALVERVL
jgi:ZIP family zinc transporter